MDVAQQLEDIAFRLRVAGETDLHRELQKAMTRAVRPVKARIQANLDPALPNRYAETLAEDMDIHVSSFSGTDPHERVSATPRVKARKLRYLDEGRLTHPLFGDREHWYTQEEPSVQPGWFTGPAESEAPRVREELERAVQDVSGKAAKGH